MFNKKLKELRENKNLSQYKLADILNMTQSAIGNWEAGQREPDFNTIIKIADYFNVSLDYLLGRTENINGNSYLTIKESKVPEEIEELWVELNDQEKNRVYGYMASIVDNKDTSPKNNKFNKRNDTD